MTAQATNGPYYSTQPDSGFVSDLNAGWDWLVGGATDVANVYTRFLSAKTADTIAKAQLAEARKPASVPNVVTTTPPLISKEVGYSLLAIAGVMVFAGVFMMARRR